MKLCNQSSNTSASSSLKIIVAAFAVLPFAHAVMTHLSEQVTAQTGITAIKQIKKSGFASIPDDAAFAKKNHLFFHLIPKGSLTDASKAQ